MEISEKYSQEQCGGNLNQSLRAKDETCKATTQKLYEYKQ